MKESALCVISAVVQVKREDIILLLTRSWDGCDRWKMLQCASFQLWSNSKYFVVNEELGWVSQMEVAAMCVISAAVQVKREYSLLKRSWDGVDKWRRLQCMSLQRWSKSTRNIWFWFSLWRFMYASCDVEMQICQSCPILPASVVLFMCIHTPRSSNLFRGQ